MTGASSGIGKQIALGRGEAGAQAVVRYSSDEDEASRLVHNIQEGGGHATAVQADVSREDQVKEMLQTACDEFGTIDILVNNAGIQKDAEFLRMTLADWQKVLDVNLTGSFLCAREAAKEFCRRGLVPERSRAAGKIIFISLVHNMIPWAGHTNYATSKGGAS